MKIYENKNGNYNHSNYKTVNGVGTAYVDCVNGNDDNNGSLDYPYKTLDKALQMGNNGFSILVINIIKGGNYEITFNRLSMADLHLVSMATDSDVYVNTPNDFRFYSSRVNVKNEGTTKFKVQINGLFEHTMLYSHKAEFVGQTTLLSSTIYFENVTFENLRPRGCNVVLKDGTVGGILDCHCSIIRITNTLTISKIDLFGCHTVIDTTSIIQNGDTQNYVIRNYGGYLSVTCTTFDKGNSTKFIENYTSTLLLPNSTLTAIKNTWGENSYAIVNNTVSNQSF
jgi:hypothetical protein